MNESERLSRLSTLSESEFRQDLLVPLLRKMGYTEVRERHGPDEYGKDITFAENTPLGRTCYAVVAKAGDISGAATGRSNLTAVKAQVGQAFDIPYYDIDNKRRQKVNHVIVWATGTISNSAETQVIDSQSDQFKNVSFKTGQSTAELVEQYFPTYFTFGDAYLSDYYAMAKDFYGRTEELRTLGTSADRFRLPVIFVPPLLKPYFPRLKGSKVETRTYSPQDIESSRDNMLVVGQMGSGKSTLLRRLLLSTIDKNESTGATSPLPILVNAKRLDLEREDAIEAALVDEVSRLSPLSEGSKLLAEGLGSSALVLIDGVDELRDEALILKAFANIGSFAERHPRARMIVSSRSIDLIDNPDVLSGFTTLQVEELSAAQTRSFIENWFGKESPIAVRLTRFLHDPLTLHGLPSTPLTLAIVAILYSHGIRELPANLTELFSKYVELALGRWDEAKELSQLFEWRIKQFLLRGVAWSMHGDRSLTLSPSSFDSITTGLARDRGLTIDPHRFRQEVADRSELLVMNDEGLYEFKHRAFQDYFAGLELISRASALDLVVQHFLEPWWGQSVFFACGLRPESADFLDRIMESSTPSSQDLLAFAFNLGLATQASYLAPRATKFAAVIRVLDAFADAYVYIEREFEELPEKPKLPPFLPPDFLVAAILAGTSRHALGSISLADVLAEIAEDYLSRDLSTLSGDQRPSLERKGLFLAVACAACDNAESFANLLESQLITNPQFRLLTIPAVFELLSHTWIPAPSLERIRRLQKRLLRASRITKRSLDRLLPSRSK
jgi:hypothetical protein